MTDFGGKIRKTPWWAHLLGWTIGIKLGRYRMWFSPEMRSAKPDRLRRGGYWKYF